MLWFWASIASAVFWGIGYAFSDYTLKHGIPVAAQLALCGFILTPFYTVLALSNGSLQKSIGLLRGDTKLATYFILAAVSYALANMLIFWSIQAKNATLSSLIEIAYPFFTPLFVWLIFGENQLSLNALAGGLLVFAGVAVIYFGR